MLKPLQVSRRVHFQAMHRQASGGAGGGGGSSGGSWAELNGTTARFIAHPCDSRVRGRRDGPLASRALALSAAERVGTTQGAARVPIESM